MVQSALSDVLLHVPRSRPEHTPCLLSDFLQLQFPPETPRTPHLVLGKSKTFHRFLFWTKILFLYDLN